MSLYVEGTRAVFDYAVGDAQTFRRSAECPEPWLWRQADDISTEVEVLALLFALTAALKPVIAVESGTWHGHGAGAIASGLAVAGRGHLWTVERDAQVAQRATQSLRASCGDLVTVVHSDDVAAVVEAQGLSGRVDLYYCDSDDLFNGARAREIRRMIPHMSERGIVAVHDVSPRYAQHRADVQALADEGLVSAVMLPTPKGFALLRRRA